MDCRPLFTNDTPAVRLHQQTPSVEAPQPCNFGSDSSLLFGMIFETCIVH